MRVIGVKCGKEQLQWAVVDGLVRRDGVIVDSGETRAPACERGEQLDWARREITELIVRHRPDKAGLRVAQAGPNVSATLGRAEMDGVIQAALFEHSIPTHRIFDATLRSAFAVKNKRELDDSILQLDFVASSPKVRRDSILAAAAEIPTA